MTQPSLCPHCHTPLTQSPAYCSHCGQAVAGASLADKVSQFSRSDLAHQPTQRFERVIPVPAPTEQLTPDLIRPGLVKGDILGRKFQITHTATLIASIYYQAKDAKGGQHLIHELVSQTPLPADTLNTLRQLSKSPIPNLQPHHHIEQIGSRRYTVLAHPGENWQSLSSIPVPLKSVKQAIGWVLQFGQALAGLHAAGYGHWVRGLPGREALILHHNHLRLSNLTHCRPLQPDTIPHDSRILAELLYYLTVGQTLADDLSLAPTQLQPLIKKSLQGHYPNLKTLLRELSAATQPPASAPTSRALRQLAGSNTHPGRKHTLNQDYIAVLNYNRDQSGQATPTGLYIVADGIGGHQAGERASRDTVKHAFHTFIEQQLLPDLRDTTRNLAQKDPGKILHKLVQQANSLIYKKAHKHAKSPGTTITCALITGNQATIANVGDSRTYLFRQGQLHQITQDHSLVATLVAAGQIPPEEIYTHSKRNQIYRSLGNKPDIEIDLFSQTLQQGDRLLLCSDGLWEMTRDDGIRQALRQHGSPQTVCDTLVDLANRNGGVDNISIIVVNIE